MASVELLQRKLDADGNEISNLGTPTAPQSATYTDLATQPSDVGAASPGSSLLAAPADHSHEGVHGVGVDGGAVATGDVNLVSGPGISLQRVGQDITIATSPGSTNKVTISHEGAAYVPGTSESIVREWLVNFDDAGAASIKAMLAAIVKASGGLGTYKLWVGATAPGATAGGTVRATFTTSSTTEEMKENLGASFANPGGQKLVQLTAVNDTANEKSYIRGIQISLG